jgi:hypothetical protein
MARCTSQHLAPLLRLLLALMVRCVPDSSAIIHTAEARTKLGGGAGSFKRMPARVVISGTSVSEGAFVASPEGVSGHRA